ncbi:MAG: methionine--tRNA ligase [Acidimicrobiales bacterium]
MPRRFNINTAIPYVNAPPHLGFALEFVEADVLARHRRQGGWEVRFQTGTDDNSLKNVRAAEVAARPVAQLVDRNAATYEALRGPLALSCDDFIRTSRDARHPPGVQRLWRACEAAGDLYRKQYEGLYCVGCELFLTPPDLTADGLCPDHGVAPEPVAEENWFFRLSRYEDAVHDALVSGRLRVEPEVRRNEAIAFVAAGLEDFSVSRSVERARGWGIPVPGDPDQVIYVWYDALAYYVSGLDYGRAGDAFRRWWVGADRRVHVIGKGILRFHAVYWPAILLSAGVPLPTDVLVHDYLTVDGRKLGKSLGNAVDPVAVVERFGTDALRWWFVRDVPRVGDADFTVDRLVASVDDDLANGLGNLASRVATMVHRYRSGVVPPADATRNGGPDRELLNAYAGLARRVDEALEAFDFRQATGAIVGVVGKANRYVETVRPWALAKAERAGEPGAAARLDTALALLVHACRALASELRPFVPGLAARLASQFRGDPLPLPGPLFPRLGGRDGAGGAELHPGLVRQAAH